MPNCDSCNVPLVVDANHYNDPDDDATEFEHVQEMHCPQCGEPYTYAVNEGKCWWSGFGTDRSYVFDVDD